MTEPLMDWNDSFPLMATYFNDLVLDGWEATQKITVMREADVNVRVGAFVAGTLAALISVCFSRVRPEDRDEVMRYLAEDCLPAARVTLGENDEDGGDGDDDEGSANLKGVKCQ